MVSLDYLLNELVYEVSQEWFIFLLISVLAAGLTYVGLRGFFTKRSAATVATQLGIGSRTEHIENNSVLVIISASVGLLVGAGMTRGDWIYSFGGGLGIGAGIAWIITGLAFVFPILIIIAFIAMLFKPVSKSIGKVWTAEIAIITVWGFFRYFVSYSYAFSSLPYTMQNVIAVAANPGVLVIVMIIGAIIAKSSGR